MVSSPCVTRQGCTNSQSTDEVFFENLRIEFTEDPPDNSYMHHDTPHRPHALPLHSSQALQSSDILAQNAFIDSDATAGASVSVKRRTDNYA